jgi:hypothetical protein
MNHQFLRIGLLGIIIATFSCKKYELTSIQSILYDTYNVGDSLIFKSVKTDSVEKYLINYKENISHTPGETFLPFGSTQRYAVIDLCLKYSSSDCHVVTNGEPILSNAQIVFTNEKGGNYINIYFKGFQGQYKNKLGMLNQNDSIIVINKIFKNYYELNSTSNCIDSSYSCAIKIIWQQKYGIVKFDLKDGDSYVRINVPDKCY